MQFSRDSRHHEQVFQKIFKNAFEFGPAVGEPMVAEIVFRIVSFLGHNQEESRGPNPNALFENFLRILPLELIIELDRDGAPNPQNSYQT